jgi:hypothetical protein
MVSLASHQGFISDFVNPTVAITNLIEDESSKCGNRKLLILPNAPASTCEKLHPHKVTSSFQILKHLKIMKIWYRKSMIIWLILAFTWM